MYFMFMSILSRRCGFIIFDAPHCRDLAFNGSHIQQLKVAVVRQFITRVQIIGFVRAYLHSQRRLKISEQC